MVIGKDAYRHASEVPEGPATFKAGARAVMALGVTKAWGSLPKKGGGSSMKSDLSVESGATPPEGAPEEDPSPLQQVEAIDERGVSEDGCSHRTEWDCPQLWRVANDMQIETLLKSIDGLPRHGGGFLVGEVLDLVLGQFIE